MWIYEYNFSALLRVLPHGILSESEDFWTTEHWHGPVEVRVTDRGRFTLTLDIQQHYPNMPAIPGLRMVIRMYLDMRLVEVLSYQGYTRSLPESTLPEAKRLQCNGKRHANLLLNDWLLSLKPMRHATDGALSCS